jgi:hypothetical protein
VVTKGVCKAGGARGGVGGVCGKAWIASALRLAGAPGGGMAAACLL